jgi:exo-1,4-beta-D-glucosaminidase
MAGLQQNGMYQDAFESLNLAEIPHAQFSAPWWYRTEFKVSSSSEHFLLRFEGINYRANIWLNGKLLANSTEIVGTFRYYDIGLDSAQLVDGDNVLAVQVFRPYDGWTSKQSSSVDLAISWLDWSPFAPDGNAGLWRNVSLKALGPLSVDVRYPLVTTTLSDDATAASFNFLIEVESFGSVATAMLYLEVPELGTFSKLVQLFPGAAQQLTIDSIEVPAEKLHLWWPWQMGEQYMYNFSVYLEDPSTGQRSINVSSRFGLREMTSSFTLRGYRLFSVNRKPILILGGGWSSDLLLRTSPERQRVELQYVRDLGLNTIRMEGKLEDDHFYDLADEYGILLMPGWACCDAWQHWKYWKAEQYFVASESLRSEVRRTRIHPSILAFFYSSDEIPPADVEAEFLKVFKEEHWPNPTLNSAAKVVSNITGPSGVKMSGPYAWVPPVYWLEDKNFKYGGAYGFLTEGGPGASPMVLEDLERTIPEDQMWPINFYWDYHCGNQKGKFGSLKYFTPPLDARYGASSSAKEYLFKSQVAAYESHRAMFEGYTRNKYKATGLIQWMLNNPWPDMIWHLYDYYLNPGGSYFGTKDALRPLHAMYSYPDQSVWLVNSGYEDVKNFTVLGNVYLIDGEIFSSTSVSYDVIKADDTGLMFNVQIPSSGFFFVRLEVLVGSDSVDESWYWYNVDQDILDWKNSTFYITACSSYADLTALSSLPPVSIAWSLVDAASPSTPIGWRSMQATVVNKSSGIAFFLHLRIHGPDGNVISPVLWEDNMFTLLPSQSRQVLVSFPADLAPTSLTVDTYNNLNQ